MAPAWNDQEYEPMEPHHFQLAIAETTFRSESDELVKAVRAVLVDGMKAVDAAAEYKISRLASVTDAAARVVQKWKAICEREKWVEKTYVLKPDDSEFVTRIERATLGPLQDKQAQKSKKKK